jgi:hypothetical protein
MLSPSIDEINTNVGKISSEIPLLQKGEKVSIKIEVSNNNDIQFESVNHFTEFLEKHLQKLILDTRCLVYIEKNTIQYDPIGPSYCSISFICLEHIQITMDRIDKNILAGLAVDQVRNGFILSINDEEKNHEALHKSVVSVIIQKCQEEIYAMLPNAKVKTLVSHYNAYFTVCAFIFN